MLPDRGEEPLSFRRVAKSELGIVNQLELDPQQVERFLGPLHAIVAAVRRGPAHAMFAVQAAGAIIGFFVVHPDPRDNACWWLGWFAMDRRVQGRGLGRIAMAEIMRRFHRVQGCRRVRLLVAPDNHGACHLYQDAGFSSVGVLPATGELILERIMPALLWARRTMRAVLGPLPIWTKRGRRRMRLRLAPGPHAAMVIGVERGPPLFA
ncbi:MAG TPA: GNAT family N-acetyltransferase [Rhodopila sp.]|jgi:ribosomal protein S18 acetylase RimI-like enzyme|nr:GNAT family N-acetyltransferase [Rhodopila sp.]